MTCRGKRLVGSLVPVRLRSWRQSTPPPVIAHIDTGRAILAVPVRYGKRTHWFYECESWAFDRATWDHYRKGFDLVHFHLTYSGVEILYMCAAATFDGFGHSSWDCTDRERRYAEKWHCGKRSMQYDRELDERYPPPERGVQEALPI